MQDHEFVGNTHVHTINSDGTGTASEIAAAARRAGIDFVLVADHNVLSAEVQGRYGTVYILAGQEVSRADHDHLLVFGAGHSLTDHGGDMQLVVDAAGAAGAVTFIAHPYERAALFPPLGTIPWRSWQVQGFTGLELWNYMSEVKGHLRGPISTLVTAFTPGLAIDGPLPETLRHWDELLRSRRVPVIGSSDAHADWYSLGPLRRQVFSYEHLFRCVNTHVLLDGPLPEQAAEAAALIYEALGRGHAFIGYDMPASTRGFRVSATLGDEAIAAMGDEVAWSPGLVLDVHSPGRGRIRLLRDGELLVSSRLPRLQYALQGPGVYRVEVTRRFRLRERAWIFANPVYVR
ncbi:MAG: CehA/McbA family metallohydrolase [Anaerolineae bacterium]